jgi:hypothetical protein
MNARAYSSLNIDTCMQPKEKWRTVMVAHFLPMTSLIREKARANPVDIQSASERKQGWINSRNQADRDTSTYKPTQPTECAQNH